MTGFREVRQTEFSSCHGGAEEHLARAAGTPIQRTQFILQWRECAVTIQAVQQIMEMRLRAHARV
jgi:hypothetical protein